jgi:hypothetical protein
MTVHDTPVFDISYRESVGSISGMAKFVVGVWRLLYLDLLWSIPV